MANIAEEVLNAYPLTSSMINWHKRGSLARSFNSNGPSLTISSVILPLNPE